MRRPGAALLSKKRDRDQSGARPPHSKEGPEGTRNLTTLLISDTVGGMKVFSIRLAIALLTFAIGVFMTFQVNRAAYYIWPDVDPPSKVHNTRPCVKVRTSD